MAFRIWRTTRATRRCAGRCLAGPTCDRWRRPLSRRSPALRHSYVTHLTEDGVDRRFIQQQVGHESDSSLAIYTHVSDDFMNTSLHKALAPAFAGA